MKRWPTKPLGEVCEFVRGISFKPTDLVEAGAPNSLPCFRTKNVQVGLETADLIHIPRAFVRTDRQLVREGDALISTANSNNLVGKCCYVPRLDYPATLGGFIAAIRSDPRQIQPRFLYYWLASPPTQVRLRGLARQTTNIANLPLTDVAKEPAPVPPLAEQERIVKLLDEADELRKLRTQADHRTAALLPALFHEMFGDPEKNQNGWPTSPLGEHIDLLTGYPFKSEEYIGSQDAVRLCRGANVLPQRIDWSDVRYWPTNRAPEVEQYKLRGGDIILAMDRPWISDGVKVARLTSADVPCLLVQRVARIRPKQTLIAEFIYHSLCHPTFAAHCNLVKTETTIPHISPRNIRSFTLPVPPLARQKAFANSLEEIRAIAVQQAGIRDRLEFLFQSLLHGAFNGDL